MGTPSEDAGRAGPLALAGLLGFPALLALGVATLGGGVGEAAWHAALAYCALVGYAAAHEAGHALTALAQGHGLRAVDVGFGPRLASARVGGVTLTLRLVPTGGRTIVDWVGGPGRRVATIAAGPLLPVLLGLATGSDALIGLGTLGLLVNAGPWPGSDGW